MSDDVVLDGDGAVVVPRDRVGEVLAAVEERHAGEDALRRRLGEGASTMDLMELRDPP